MKIKRSRGDFAFDIINTVLITILFLVITYPLIYVLSCSVSSPRLVGAGEIWLLPKGFNMSGYATVFASNELITGYLNTIFYTVTGTLVNLLVTVPAGYALSKRELPGRGVILGAFMFTMYFSGGLIPTFLLVQKLGLFDNRAVMVLLGAFSVYNCIICLTFFSGLPKELEEAALIDGSSTPRTFLSIVLPLSKALLGVMVLYFAVGHWNSYFNAMIYLTGPEKRPLQLVLRRILILETISDDMMSGASDDYMVEKAEVRELIKYAVIVVSSLPVLILYPFLQKYFDKGVLIGSVKG